MSSTACSSHSTSPPGAQGANWGIGSAAYLVFDPAVSLHFEVFLLPDQLPEMPEPPVPVKSSPPPFNVGRLFMSGGADGDLWPEVDTDDDDDGEDWFVDSQEDQTRPHYYSSERCEVRDAMGLMEWPPPRQEENPLEILGLAAEAQIGWGDGVQGLQTLQPSNVSSASMAYFGQLGMSLYARLEGKEILKIKASPRLGADFLAWGAECTGIFTVRSAYRLALEDKLRPSSVAASRAPDGRRAAWALLWRCPAPPKVPSGGAFVEDYGGGQDRSQYAMVVSEVKHLMSERECHVIHISREQNNEYQVIQSPRIVSPYNWWEKPITYLGKSKKGVYYTATDYLKLRVWLLTEETAEASRGALPVWEMIHNADLEPPLSQLPHENCEEKDKSWILDHEKAVQIEQGYREWDSDNDDRFVSNDEQHDEDDENYDYADGGYMTMSSLDLLGYHPHKEIILLGSRDVGDGCAFAYYLDTMKCEYLGDLYPVRGEWITFWPKVRESYVYTPCSIDLLPEQNGTSTDLS
uniref:Uncharacterized protein n=1 Tax=Aegilops tauschii TaxID=37682 RepID=R7WD28_AEGTA